MGIFSSDEEPSWSDIYNLQTNKVMLELKIDKLEAENDKLRTCLQEIKEIATDAYENENEYQATGVYNEIIQKITKMGSEE